MGLDSVTLAALVHSDSGAAQSDATGDALHNGEGLRQRRTANGGETDVANLTETAERAGTALADGSSSALDVPDLESGGGYAPIGGPDSDTSSSSHLSPEAHLAWVQVLVTRAKCAGRKKGLNTVLEEHLSHLYGVIAQALPTLMSDSVLDLHSRPTGRVDVGMLDTIFAGPETPQKCFRVPSRDEVRIAWPALERLWERYGPSFEAVNEITRAGAEHRPLNLPATQDAIAARISSGGATPSATADAGVARRAGGALRLGRADDADGVPFDADADAPPPLPAAMPTVASQPSPIFSYISFAPVSSAWERFMVAVKVSASFSSGAFLRRSAADGEAASAKLMSATADLIHCMATLRARLASVVSVQEEGALLQPPLLLAAETNLSRAARAFEAASANAYKMETAMVKEEGIVDAGQYWRSKYPERFFPYLKEGNMSLKDREEWLNGDLDRSQQQPPNKRDRREYFFGASTAPASAPVPAPTPAPTPCAPVSPPRTVLLHFSLSEK